MSDSQSGTMLRQRIPSSNLRKRTVSSATLSDGFNSHGKLQVDDLAPSIQTVPLAVDFWSLRFQQLPPLESFTVPTETTPVSVPATPVKPMEPMEIDPLSRSGKPIYMVVPDRTVQVVGAGKNWMSRIESFILSP